MVKRVLIIGGYGNFGSFIAKRLSKENNIQLIIAGRDKDKAQKFANSLNATNKIESAQLDINNGLESKLAKIKPDIVIHTSGPYQGQGYHVAAACIEQGCHYIDLADAREFVTSIVNLDKKAKEKNLLICSGASSVPCLTAAIIDKYISNFKKLEKIDYAIASAQLTTRGLATTLSVLSYAGRPFTTLIEGKKIDIFGWLDLKFYKFWGLGWRPLGNCNVPDLEIFPSRYPDLKTIRFRAGIEIKMLHIGLFLLSWLVRLRLICSLKFAAKTLLKVSRLFDLIGKDDSGFYMLLSGIDENGKDKNINFEILAKTGDGLFIPSMPSILLAIKLANGSIAKTGAQPCLDIITLDEYLKELEALDIKWRVS